MDTGIVVKIAEQSKRSAIVPAILAGVAMAAGVIALWYIIEERAHEHASSSTQHTIHMNELLIQQDSNNRRLALDRLASRSVTAGARTQSEWQADANRYLRDMPGFVTIEWIDTQLETRFRVTADDNPETGEDAAAIPDIKSAIAQSQQIQSQVFSSVFTRVGGVIQLAIVVPVLHRSEVEGVIVGVLDPAQWMDAVIGDLQDADHHVEVQLDGHTVFHHGIPSDVPDPDRVLTHDFKAGGLNWTMQVTPTTSFLSAGHADSSTLVLLAGLLLSAVTT